MVAACWPDAPAYIESGETAIRLDIVTRWARPGVPDAKRPGVVPVVAKTPSQQDHGGRTTPRRTSGAPGWGKPPGIERGTPRQPAWRSMGRKERRRSTRFAPSIHFWCADPRNRSSSGYELQPGGGGLKQGFQPFEGTIRGSVSSSPTRLIRKCRPKVYLLMGVFVNAPRWICTEIDSISEGCELIRRYTVRIHNRSLVHVQSRPIFGGMGFLARAPSSR